MTISRRFNAAVSLATLLGTLTFCLADERPLLALISLPIVLAGYLCGRGRRKPDGVQDFEHPVALPRPLVNLLVLAAILNAAIHAAGARTIGLPIVSHLGEFLVYVQLLKLFDRRTARDESQLLTLSVFVALAALLTSNSLITGVLVLLYTPFAVSAVMLYQLRAGESRVSQSRASSVATDVPLSSHGRRFVGQLRSTVGASVVFSCILAAVVFIITPRGLGISALGQFGQTRGAEIGYSDQIKLGRAMSLSQNPTPVLDLAVSDVNGVNQGGTDRLYYLRGYTRDHYEPETRLWVKSTNPQHASDRLRPDSTLVLPTPAGSKPVPSTMRIRQRITLRPSLQSDILAVWRPLNLSSSDANFLQDESDSKIQTDLSDLSMKRGRPNSRSITYTVESVLGDLDVGEVPKSPLGFQEGPIRELAIAILVGRGIPVDPVLRNRGENRAAANAFRDYLVKTCTYTLDLWQAAEGQDPLVEFLFERKTGHCEYFASAFVAMCQAVGMHARVVGGFVAGEYNGLSGTYVVRQSNAHTWGEYHLGDGVWTWIEPSPSADVSRIHHASEGWRAAIRRWWDSLEFGWNRSIVSFDSSQQERAIGRSVDYSGFSRWFSKLSDNILKAARGGPGRAFRVPAWVYYILPAMMLVATVAVATGRLGRIPWRRLLRLGRSDVDPRMRALLADASFYTSALRALERAGDDLAKPDSAPPLAHADSLAARLPAVSGAFRTLSEIYYSARFGRRPLSHAEQSRGQEALKSLRAALKGADR